MGVKKEPSMTSIQATQSFSNPSISEIEVTSDCLTDRAGLAMVMRFLDQSGIIGELSRIFEPYRSSNKGTTVPHMVRQVLAFLMDGTSRHLTRFDQMKHDAGYSTALETPAAQMVSSHGVKRLFAKLPKTLVSPFRRILRDMVITRICREKPPVIELFLDTMVMDNDEAAHRQGVGPTYKKVKGFQPLQLIWDGQIVDAQFRGGIKNGNHGLTAFRMIERVAREIRGRYRNDVPVIVRMDGGFFDGDLFWRLDASNIGFVCTGRMSKDIKAYFAELDTDSLPLLTKGNQAWRFAEFATRCKSWDHFYQAVYMQQVVEGSQGVFDFATKDQILISNLGTNRIFKNIPLEDQERFSRAEYLIEMHHTKGADELTHRRLKDFGFQELPFKSFASNQAIYYLMVIGYNLMEFFKRDVLTEQVLKGSYATTIRRCFIDFAAKFVRSGRKLVMKVTAATMERIHLRELWTRCNQTRPLF